MESVLVTGANRGIGLEIVRRLAELPRPPRYVFATYRDKKSIRVLRSISDKSKKMQIKLIQMDVTEKRSVEKARKEIEAAVGDGGLNLLINNAGTAKWQYIPQTTKMNLQHHYETNTVGAVTVLQEMLPLLEKSASVKSAAEKSRMSVSRGAVVNISDRHGSIAELTDVHMENWRGLMGYRSSKAALNMAMRIYALWVKDKGVLVVNICPGWVRTDMGLKDADLHVSESVSDLLRLFPLLDDSHHGTFIDRKGDSIPY
ncbi:c-factor [Nephila pilipes]|uniref:C-factor n=1 Tax=Nephila pilipes TaxID=299642 RepID=A0A8X6TBW9_NEPPI|nr:c-factor [Nephila pilipes]